MARCKRIESSMTRNRTGGAEARPPRGNRQAAVTSGLAVSACCAFLASAATYANDGLPARTIAAMLNEYRRPSPAAIPAPPDNPITRQKVALGKALFFDPRLSGSGVIACASCHNPALAWEDGRPLGIGHAGTILPRHTPTILNIAWAEPLFWDGRAGTLEEQAKGPIAAPAEMNMPLEQGVAAIRAIPGYRAAFRAAFPNEPLGTGTLLKAIASYQRTIVSATAPFDRWVAGDERALSPSARRGFVLFNTKAGCATCHSGWRFTDDGFHDIGLPGEDLGRARIMPGLTILEYAFKTPTLRNIAERAPYMHDGSIPTLAAVVDHYDRGYLQRPSLSPEIRPLNLTVQDKADLIAFMTSLSSPDAPVLPPNLPH